jgi:hypothetical protein
VKFEVKLERKEPICGNPFRAGLVWETRKVEVRTFQMDCESEEEVRRFFKEAKEQDLPNVRGFELRSITLLSAKRRKR